MIQSSNTRQYGYHEPVKLPERQIILKRRWRFRPRSVWPFLVWGFALFLGVKLLLIPLVEGVYGFVVKVQEVKELKAQYHSMEQKIADMTKARDYMKTPAYIEERGHQIGLIKSNEAKMVVVDSRGGVKVKKKPQKHVEIGD